MRHRFFLAGAVLYLLAVTCGAWAQGAGSSGNISGTVVDAAGAVLPRALIVATEQDKGIQHRTETDDRGHYRFRGLRPAIYNVTATSPGFSSEVREGIGVILGETATVDFNLRVTAVSTQVEYKVESAPPVVDVERASQSSTLSEQYIDGLPIDRRDYLSFALLSPGVTQTLTIADNRDLRAKQLPQSGLSVYGSNGRGNSVTVDGVSFNGYSQYVRANVSQDAVQEFQINRADYSVVLGGASGAAINIVTKSGTNSLHGSLYGFFRNSALDARDPFAFSQALTPGQPFSLNATAQPVKNYLSRQQFGGAAGFPLRKDRTFLFVAYEGLLQDQQASVPLLTNSDIFAPQAGQQSIMNGLAALGGTPVPCLTGQPALPAATCAAILQNVLTINPAASPLNQFLVNRFVTSGGLKPFPVTSHQGSLRLDHQFNDRNQASLRIIAAHIEDSQPGGQSFNNEASVLQLTSSLQASWLHTFNADMLNETRIAWSVNQDDTLSNSAGETNLSLAGFAGFGKNFALPNYSRERDYEFADNFTRVHGRHIFELGADETVRANHTASFAFMGGEFAFGELPGGILSPCLQVPAACGLTSAPATINSLQSFSLGLPGAYIQGFGDPNVTTMLPWTSAYFQDNWSVTPHLHLHLGVRYELDQRAYINTTYHDVAPRASLAWDPIGDHKTVVRAGFGLYYAPIPIMLEQANYGFNGLNSPRRETAFMVPLNGLPGNPAVNSAAIFQTLFAAGKMMCQPNPTGCITPADLAPFGISVSTSGPLPPYAITLGVAPNFHNPYSEQASLGVERELLRDVTVSANYIYVHTLHLSRINDTNVLPGAPMVSGVPGTNGLSFQNWGAPQCQVMVNNPCFVNPLLLNNGTFVSEAAAVYQGGTLELKKRYRHHLTMMASYTYSKAMDDVPDFMYWASNQAQTRAERALSSYDQRHRIIVAGIVESPFRSGALGGFELAPVLEYDSARPFNLYTGTDMNGDHTDFADRPPGAGRNTGLGPNYLGLDLRLSRRFKIGDRAGIQFTAEAFNIANRTNYATVNDEVGASFAPPFKVHGSAQLLPSQPLGFTSDFPKREFQLGARFSF